MVFLESWFNWLLIFIPITIIVDFLELGAGLEFTCACIALVPLAERLSFATEQLALYTTPTIGGLLNATFGNISELVFVILSIVQGYNNLASLFLLGSILGNLLLVLGMAFFIGGLRHDEQRYPKQGTIANMGILLLGTVSLVVPAVLNATSTQADIAFPFQDVLKVSRVTSIFLITLYFPYIYFQLFTHVHLFDEVDQDDLEEGEHEEPVLGLWMSVFWLAVFAAFITVMSDVAVESIVTLAQLAADLPVGFLTAILLPVVGNVAEHSSAIIFAYKNEMPIVLGICVGSATQIMIFMVPFAVLFAWTIGQPLALDFNVFETVVTFVTVVAAAIVVSDGRSNWFKGLLLMSVYCVIATGFWFHAVDITV